MKAQGVPFGGLPWEAPTPRLGRFLPASRDELHLRLTPLVSRAGGTNPPATRFPRGNRPPRPARPHPSLGRVSRPKTTTGDHNVPSPPRPVVLYGPSSPSCCAFFHRSRQALVNRAFVPASRRRHSLKKCPRMLHARQLFVRDRPGRPASPTLVEVRGEGPRGPSPTLAGDHWV